MDSNGNKKPLFKVRARTACANIGPGYDIAAIALDIFSEYSVLYYYL